MKSKIIGSLVVSITAVFFYSSCAKIDSTSLGVDLLPTVDNIHTFETILDVVTDNRMFDDTTRMLYGEDHALGIIENDLEFGGTDALIYAAFGPTAYKTYPFQRRDTVVVDSVVLSLAYSSLFGDSTSVQAIEVREMDPAVVFPDSAYMLNRNEFPVLPDLLASSSVSFLTLNDSVQYVNGLDTVRTVNELRVHMDTGWARRFINYDTSTAYSNDSTFKTFFRGLEIRPAETSLQKNALAYFNLTDAARTRITFYCRVQRDGKTDTIAPYFTNGNGSHANIVRRTPANAYLANLTNGIDNDEKIYLQTAPGSYATVHIPGLDTLSNRVIHRAELIVEKHPSEQDFYRPPAALFIDAMSTTGDSAFTIRNDFERITAAPGYNLSLLGGVYKNNQYVFNLSRYIQSVVTKGFPNYTLRIYAPFTTYPYFMSPNENTISGRHGVLLNSPVADGRVVLYGGGSAGEKRMRLRIIYSRI